MIMVFGSIVAYLTLFFYFFKFLSEVGKKEVIGNYVESPVKTVSVRPIAYKQINTRPEPAVVAVAPQVIGSTYNGRKEMW